MLVWNRSGPSSGILIWREEALADLDEIVTYVGERNFEAAQRPRDRIKSYAENLPDRPFAHRPVGSTERARLSYIRTIFWFIA